jgi:hypothetical protein
MNQDFIIRKTKLITLIDLCNDTDDIDKKKNILMLGNNISSVLEKYIIKKPNKLKKLLKLYSSTKDINTKIPKLTQSLLEYFGESPITLIRNYISTEYKLAEKKFKDKFPSKEYVYDNQIQTAKNIITELLDNKKKAVSLVALPQVGKTGTFLYTAVLAGTHPNDLLIVKPENIYIITGMSDKEWQTQTENDMISIFKHNVYHHGKLTKFEKKVKETSKTDTILIIVDECHIATQKDQLMDKILKNILDITNTKDINELTNIKFLNVSATPSSVLRAMEKWGSENHSIVYLKPSDKYVGFDIFLKQNRICESKELDLENKFLNTKVLPIIKSRYNEPKYHIFRLNHARKILLLEQFCRKNKFNFIHHNSKDRQNFDEDIKTKPDVHTFVIIKNFYRAGKRMNDKNIGIAYEHNNKINYDITPQGLIGRFCGNDKIKTKDNSPYFFCNIDAIKGYIDFIENGCDMKKSDYISKNFTITNGQIKKVTDTLYDNIVNTDFEDNLLNKSDYIDIPYLIDIKDNEWKRLLEFKDKDSEKENYGLKIIKNNNNKLYNIIKSYKCYKFATPIADYSYKMHITLVVDAINEKSPYIKDVPKKYKHSNVWGGFIDHKEPRMIIMVYHGTKLFEYEKTIKTLDSDTESEEEIKPKKKRTVTVKAQK